MIAQRFVRMDTAMHTQRVTQRDLAQRTGIPVTRISSLQHGRVLPYQTEAIKIAAALKMSVNILFTEVA